MAIRRRIYNPAHLTRDELKASFVARADTLAEMLRVIGGQKPDRPCQHMLLIGPRGMGKTTLGLRFLYAIEDDPELCRHWQPVAFHEESYGITSLADFWIHALRHLTAATGDPHWKERAESFSRDERDLERASAYALAELMDFSQGSGKRLILFVENLDAVIGQIHDERQIHSLRATLIERPEILLLGSANSFFKTIGGYGEPLYEFFRILKLKGIGQEEAQKILETTGSSYREPEAPESLRVEYGRLETIRQLTGGNPRLLGLACRLLIESPLGSAVEDLERLIDEQTPYFKARIEDLPGQSRKVFHCLSEGWSPLLAKEVADAARLTSSHASAQLKQLVDKGYAREVHLPHSKRARYDVSDRFYNIYYLLRFSRSGRVRLERLVAFLHDLFGSSAESAFERATEIDQNHPVSHAHWGRSILWQTTSERLSEAEKLATRAVELNSDNRVALLTLANVLAQRGNWVEALDRLEQALGSDDGEMKGRAGADVVVSLIGAAAAGYSRRVKRIMEDGGLVESMEPLWHAIRAELGEELEPLPAEVMDVVELLRRRIAGDPAPSKSD